MEGFSAKGRADLMQGLELMYNHIELMKALDATTVVRRCEPAEMAIELMKCPIEHLYSGSRAVCLFYKIKKAREHPLAQPILQAIEARLAEAGTPLPADRVAELQPLLDRD